MSSSDESAPEHRIPGEFEWFREQIGGHHPSQVKNGKREIGFLKEKKSTSNCILKLRQSGKRGDCEVKFYQLFNRISTPDYDYNEDQMDEQFPGNSITSDEDLLYTRFLQEEQFIPQFHGLRHIPINGAEAEFLILDDLTRPYRLPAILDVKMGKVTYDPDASDKKIKSESEKYPPQRTLGFRLLGYRIHKVDESVESCDREWGKSKDETNIGQALYDFFSARPEAAALALRRITLLREWFEKQSIFHFFASSLLFVFETHPDLPPSVEVRMIDFGHVYPGNGALDENYNHGLNNLISLLEEMLLKSA